MNCPTLNIPCALAVFILALLNGRFPMFAQGNDAAASVETRTSTTTTSESSSSSSANNKSTTLELWPPAVNSNRPPLASDLHAEYYSIFRHGNRNAASHLWASFLLNRAHQFASLERWQFYMTAFCIVSGSPVRPSDYNRYRLTLPFVGQNKKDEEEKAPGSSTSTDDENNNKKNQSWFVTGFLHYCCWPCVCDTQDLVKIDTATIQLADGSRHTRYFAVIGNPCNHASALEEPFIQPYGRQRTTTLQEVAPEVRCREDGSLEGATVSDHGYIILGMFLDAELSVVDTVRSALPNPEPGRISTVERQTNNENNKSNKNAGSGMLLFQDEREWEPQCRERAANGYNSGMGEIFRKVSAISPIQIQQQQQRDQSSSLSSSPPKSPMCVESVTLEEE